MRKIDTIVIHCSATPDGRPVSVATIRKWHMDRGWNDIGYHFVVGLQGEIWPGRPVEAKGAHVRGHNSHTIGICYVGGVTNDGKLSPKDTRTPQQKAALDALIRGLLVDFPAITTICGHRDFPGVRKACPCFDAVPEYDHLLMGDPVPVARVVLPVAVHEEPDTKIEPAFQSEKICDGVAVVPGAIDRPAIKTVGFWERIGTVFFGGGGMIGASLFSDWRVVAISGGVVIGLALLGLVFHGRLILAVKSLKAELQ
ncbi:N-acetylmuramoyl-L-alanine amidase [Roseibium polysiphoniae]|uniref:N-acetylmuramoyl-L-alanine amidase n=1 Tax=Roseibium polysiphoniae TaxID=2571221 RepID=A0ABR9C6D1_9HYPH|nr:N-acetylmuramoyl-L-alanine amidase [Roseibium polysiphoniae]MBD8875448.1 N-acetylmuramoyl-L-alanine amidase [Roseibium polysiphoniae]